MSSKRKGKKEDSRVAKAARFFLACKQNPDPAVKVNILQAMRSWGYSNEETLNRTLQMQVHRAVKALKGEDTAAHPNPATVAATALLALSGGAMNPVRGVLSNITKIPAAAASIIAAAATAARGGRTDILSPLTGLLSPLKETLQTSHQAQVNCGKIRTHTISPFLGLLNSSLRRG
jgi:hypothetical protein